MGFVFQPSHHVTRSIVMERIWKSRITGEEACSFFV